MGGWSCRGVCHGCQDLLTLLVMIRGINYSFYVTAVSLLLLCSALGARLHCDPCRNVRRALKQSQTSKPRLNLLTMSYACVKVCEGVCLLCTDFHVRSLVHSPECMLARVPACVCMPSGTERVCGEHAADVFNFKDAGTLCRVRLHADRPSLMNNYLQECKTIPLIMMRCQATFQHDSP